MSSLVADPPKSPLLRATAIDPFALTGHCLAYNSSIIRHDGRLLMATRDNHAGSRIVIAGLTDSLLPTGSVKVAHLESCPLSQWGCEDPRLFHHRGVLYLMWIGVVGDPGNGNPGSTHVLYAPLNDELQLCRINETDRRAIFYPHYARRNPIWEKNWQFFSWEDELFCVYTIVPHRVLSVRGPEATDYMTQAVPLPYTGGVMRGGAPPVRVGEEFWCWFHGRVEGGFPLPTGPAKTRTYNAGLYTFDAFPPFRPRRLIRDPLLWPDYSKKPRDQWANVVFPNGAILEDGRWVVSCGIDDRTTTIYEFDHAALDEILEPV